MEPTTMDRPVQQGGATASTEVPSVQTSSPASPPAPGERAPALVSTRDTLFSRRAPKLTAVDVPDYGEARVASLTQGQWEDLNARHEKDGKTDTAHGYMSEAVAAALCERDGSPVFDDHVEGGKQVRTLPLPVVAKLFEAVATASGLTAEAREKLGKGSEPTPSGAG
jgi:hypothetical protein